MGGQEKVSGLRHIFLVMGRLYIDGTTLRECSLCYQCKPVLRHTSHHKVVGWSKFNSHETNCYHPAVLDIVALGPCNRYAHRLCGQCLRTLIKALPNTTTAAPTCPFPFGPKPCDAIWRRQDLHFLFTYEEWWVPIWQPPRTQGVLWCKKEHAEREGQFEYAKVGQQILHILSTESAQSVKCPECDYLLSKSIMCNALSHCGWEICFVCGQYERPALPLNHWERCPRYNHDDYWKTQAPHYQCRENRCYSETQDCYEPTHALGRQQMNLARQQFQLQAVWQVLSETQRKHFLPLLTKEKRWVV